MIFELKLSPGQLSLADLRNVYRYPTRLVVDPAAWSAVERSRQRVLETIAGGATVYGINTGFGRLAQKPIGVEQLAVLQRNLVLSQHECRVRTHHPQVKLLPLCQQKSDVLR